MTLITLTIVHGSIKIYLQGCHFTLKNLEFDNFGKKTWNQRNKKKTQKNLEFLTKVFKKPGIFNNFNMFSSKISL